MSLTVVGLCVIGLLLLKRAAHRAALVGAATGGNLKGCLGYRALGATHMIKR